MLRNTILILIVLLSQTSFGQVGIGTSSPNSSAILDLTATNKGFLPAKVALVATNNPNPTATTNSGNINGLIVFNTAIAGTSPYNVFRGYYVWNTNQWERIGNEQYHYSFVPKIDPDWLGYNPSGTAAAAQNKSGFIPPGSTAVNITNKQCKQWTTGNNHQYCTFDLSRGVSWKDAYEIAKSYGGYLVTFPTLEEWNWVKTNVIDPTTGFDKRSAIWIGFNKVTDKGNGIRMEWITGEKSKVMWNKIYNEQNIDATTGQLNRDGGDFHSNPKTSEYSTIEHNFLRTNPDNAYSEGCTHIVARRNDNAAGVDGALRLWNDYPCGETSWSYSGSNPFNQIIVEFNQ